MSTTPHKEKLIAALSNPKCVKDMGLLQEGIELYEEWIRRINQLKGDGKDRIDRLVGFLNWYKDNFEVELIMKKGSAFIKRQKGQLKLDNTIIEEFLVHLINPKIIKGLKNIEYLEIGPQNAFMSLAFLPKSINELSERPNVFLKTKDQDFIIGKKIHYKLSTDSEFIKDKTATGALTLAVLAAECKVNLDKTMFQEAAGTASRLKQGCPVARYYVLIEYLDMTPEDCRLTAIDNVFLLRRAKRLPFEKRSIIKEVERQHKEFPINSEVVWMFIQEIQKFIDSVWYDTDEALKRGSFI